MATPDKDRATMIGVFEDLRLAQEAVRELREAGFTEAQIGVLSHERQPDRSEAVTDEESRTAEGAVAGMAAGASVGALWAVGIAVGVLPAVGPVIAGGLLASVLASAAGVGAVAGLLGALVGLGIPEHEAKFYEEEFRSGRTIVTVNASGRHDEIASIFESYGAYDMRNRELHRKDRTGKDSSRLDRPTAGGDTLGTDLSATTARAVAAGETLAEDDFARDRSAADTQSLDDLARRRPR